MESGGKKQRPRATVKHMRHTMTLLEQGNQVTQV